MPEAAEDIRDGDVVEVDFDTGTITNMTRNRSYRAVPFPGFMQEIIRAEGLVGYIRNQG